MENYEFMLVSSLEKVFPKVRPLALKKRTIISGLKGDIISFQVAYKVDNIEGYTLTKGVHLEIKSKLKNQTKVRSVELVPSLLPVYEKHDDNYITLDPGVFPDLLRDLPKDGEIKGIPLQWRAIWIDVELENQIEAGQYEIELLIKAKDHKIIWNESIFVEIIDISLPEQKLIHTEWFHADCLADYYNLDVFSNRHWEVIEEQIKVAAKYGVNMMLTPIFTPPLDTQQGGERTTVQLIDIYKEDEMYTFDFSKLKKWISICRKYNIKYLEIVHFFTQWGAKFTPKIMVWEEETYKRIFGWDVPATCDSYKNFISQLIPSLLKVLKEEGFSEANTYFHISDEPTIDQMASYGEAKKVVEDYLKGYKIIDALSDYEFYTYNLVENPVPANDHIQPFIDQNVEDLWVYYCCVQSVGVPNRFMAMPSARNRILGVLLYYYNIKGFLHWGYNFYNSRFSKEKINPYYITDAKEAFASGDAFLVYPGEDGKPEESIRLMVLSQGLNDLRAFELLESITTREYVIGMIQEGIDDKITFKDYPKSPDYLERLRNRVNEEIGRIYNKI